MTSQFQLQEFDSTDPNNIGRPAYFNVDKYLDCVEDMITADEVERAIWMLDNMPGWYRDNVPLKAKEMKNRLLTKFFSTLDYANEPIEEQILGHLDKLVSRGELVLNFCKSLNEAGKVPHIVDIGPGNYWLPGLLSSYEINFSYFGPAMNKNLQAMAQEKFKKHWSRFPKESEQSTFVCFEMLEHLHFEGEIYQNYLKYAPNAETIFLSTPKYTWGGGMAKWYANDLGHLRTYTPSELGAFVLKNWPEFNWQIASDHVMHAIGTSK